MRLVNELLKFFLVVFPQTLSFGEPQLSEPVHLGVHVFYDRQIYNNIIDRYGHEYYAKNGDPYDYFTALLAAVELRFRDMQNPIINISLVGITLLNDDRASVVAAPALYEDTIDGTETMSKLQNELLLQHPKVSEEAHIVFLVTTKYISTKFEASKDTKYLSFGLPKTGGVCDNGINTGLVRDDGKTFKGVEDVAQQIAVLLGASLNSTCSKRAINYPRSIFPKESSTLLNCTKEEIYHFLSSKTIGVDCLTKPAVKTAIRQKILPAAYNNITGYDMCKAGTTGRYREVRQCKPGDERTRYNRTCEVQCCEYNSRFARNGLSVYLWNLKVGDGEPCNETQICINGKCEENETLEK